MEFAATARTGSPTRFALRRIDGHALRAWVLAFAVILYMALDGGGYSLASHGQVGIVIWWVAVISAAWGLLPATRFTRPALITIGLFAAFTAWTALGITWSISPGRSLDDLALVSCYLGILVLASAIHRERAAAVNHTMNAVASAITTVAILALASRLWPHMFASSSQTGHFLAGAQARLSWPLNYWNALATLMAVGLPLLLTIASSARTLRGQSAAAAAIPVVALCGALTLSRGGMLEALVGVGVFLALAPDRIPKLGTVAVTAIGSAIAIDAAFRRHDLQQGLATAAEHHQATTVLITLLLACGGVALAQTGVGLLARHATLPRLLTASVRQARALTAIAVVAVIAIAFAAGAPSRIAHAWQQFKSPHTQISGTTTSRFGSSSGEGRYQYWQAAIDSAEPHVFTGSGPGTFQLDWLPRAPFASYVTNAHSLYVETYAELGVVGLLLLLGFFVAALTTLVRLVISSRYEQRTRVAAIVAAVAAFLVSASFDWTWQVSVVPAAILLLIAAALAPKGPGIAFSRLSRGPATTKRTPVAFSVRQALLVALGLACLFATAFPLATQTAIGRSQQAAATGHVAIALADARDAANLEPGSGAAQIQLALVLETRRDYGAAINAAHRAIADDPQNWSNWLTLSRLEAESGRASDAVTAYEKAKNLNPQSSLFTSHA